MLSASTISSNSPEAFSPRTASSTPLSQYSNSSTPKTAGNPLTELIETEKSYMETLKIIDSQLAPLWTDTSVIDFTELLKYVHDILKANKRFCSKLTRIAANPQTIKELGDVLMQWIDDMEVPYANYSRAYISNLNTRTDVLSNPDIKQLLQDLSRSASYEITLESLFNAPVQQLKYYKVLYGRLLDSAEPGRADHKLLVKANKRIDTVMLMAQKNLPSSTAAEQHTATKSLHHHHHYTKALPVVTPIQTDISVTAAAAASSTVDFMDLGAFQRHLDSSQAKDIFNGVHVQCQPRLATPGAKIIFRDNFVLLPDGLNSASPQRVHVVLTTYVLVITQESNGSYSLMYPPIAVYDLSVNAAQVDRELIGEYIIQVDVLGKKKILLRADTKETRNKWVGIDEAASGSAALNAKPMRDIVSKLAGDTADKQADEGDKPKRSSRKSVIRKQDIVSFYTDQSGEISPLSSDESDIEDKFSLFGGRTPFSAKADRISKTDLSVKDLPPAPPSSLNANAAPPPPPKQKQGSHLQPATSIDNRPLPRAPSPAPSHHLENSGHSRPVSPRTIEIKHTVTPVAMQATTQSSEFLTNGNAKQSGVVDNASSNGPTQQALQGSGTSLPRTSSISRTASPAAGQLPTPTRSSSFRQQQQQQQQQQQPTGGSPQLHPSGKPLPQEPSTHHSQQHHQHHPPPNPQPHYQPQPRLQSAAGPQQHTMAQHRSPQQQQQPPMMAAPQHYRSAPSSPTQRPTMMMGNVPPPINRAPSTGMGPDGYSGQQDSMRPAAAPATNNYLNVQRPSLAHHRSMEELNSPPRSPTPNGNPNSIKQTLYSNGQCEVFHWKSESWYAVDGHCLLHVRQTFTNRSCVAIQLQNTGQLYLNAWILPNTVIAQPSPTDVSLTVYMGANRENYLVHFASHADARTLFQLLQRMHQEAVQMNMTPENSNTLRGAPPGMIRSRSFDVRDLDDDPVESNQAKVPQTLRLVMQCKCKLFVQNEHSNWSSFGSVTMKISQQLPSKKMHIEIENGKGPKATKLVSASVQSRNVERISSKRITFLLINEQERTSMVYMVQIKEEETGNKIFEYLKTKNAENGW